MGIEGKNKQKAGQFKDVFGKAATPPTPAEGPLVEATRKGFYGGVRLRPGRQFKLQKPEHFDKDWMKKVDAATRAASPPPPAKSSASTRGDDNPMGID